MSFFSKVGYPNDFSSLPIKDVSHGAQPRPTIEIGKVFNTSHFSITIVKKQLTFNTGKLVPASLENTVNYGCLTILEHKKFLPRFTAC